MCKGKKSCSRTGRATYLTSMLYGLTEKNSATTHPTTRIVYHGGGQFQLHQGKVEIVYVP